jgi:hypothetical protein
MGYRGALALADDNQLRGGALPAAQLNVVLEKPCGGWDGAGYPQRQAEGVCSLLVREADELKRAVLRQPLTQYRCQSLDISSSAHPLVQRIVVATKASDFNFDARPSRGGADEAAEAGIRGFRDAYPEQPDKGQDQHAQDEKTAGAQQPVSRTRALRARPERKRCE